MRQGDVLYVLSLERKSDAASGGLAGITRAGRRPAATCTASWVEFKIGQLEQRANLTRKQKPPTRPNCG